MKQKMYAVRDSAIDAFGPVMFLQSDGEALRMLGDTLNNREKGNMLAAHPEHFELFYLGEYDTADGCFTATRPKSIILASSLVVKE